MPRRPVVTVGSVTCASNATDGTGNWANARGGNGGKAPFKSNVGGFILAADVFAAGDGGVGTANGGKGRFDGDGGNANADAGKSGDATATGGDCTNCSDAGDGTATTLDGGKAKAVFGVKGGATGMDGVSTAFGGDAGKATAGNGGNANVRGAASNSVVTAAMQPQMVVATALHAVIRYPRVAMVAAVEMPTRLPGMAETAQLPEATDPMMAVPAAAATEVTVKVRVDLEPAELVRVCRMICPTVAPAHPVSAVLRGSPGKLT
jgi:hypothetical protein